MHTQDLHSMTTSALDAALGLARLVVKAHASVAPEDTTAVARELLAALLTGTGAACGALVVTQSPLGADVGTHLRTAQVLSSLGVDAGLVPSLLAELAPPRDDHTTPRGRNWIRITIPLDGQMPPSDGMPQPGADTAHVVLAWEGEVPAEQRVRGQNYISALRDAITAVVVSLLAAERAGDHLNAELLGTVSHELRSPLAAIKGYASTLLRHERRLPREERQEFLAAIDEATIRLETIINRLLEMSELETGHAVLDRFAMDLVPVVRDAVTDARANTAIPARPPTTITVRLQDADGLDAGHQPLILADPRAMREVIDNLLENAVKYSPQGGQITVTLRPTMMNEVDAPAMPMPESGGGEGFLEVTVSDQGIGIPDEHLGRIFDRFHRVDTRLTREVDGLGLGLAICRRLVELHGGAIWAESQPGEGSVFHILLPVAA
jgi:signal transduction histidine kinase